MGSLLRYHSLTLSPFYLNPEVLVVRPLESSVGFTQTLTPSVRVHTSGHSHNMLTKGTHIRVGTYGRSSEPKRLTQVIEYIQSDIKIKLSTKEYTRCEQVTCWTCRRVSPRLPGDFSGHID